MKIFVGGVIMKLLNLEQNTPEWLLSRIEVIGGSEVPTIVMGVSPYEGGKNRNAFIKEKAAARFKLRELKERGLTNKNIIEGGYFPEPKSSPVMALGHYVEKTQRPMTELELGKNFPPKVARHDYYDFLSVSFDGLANDFSVWECKYTGNNKVLSAIGGEIPKHFYLQVQYQLFISGGQNGFLTMVSLKQDRRSVNNVVTTKIRRDEKVIKQIENWCVWCNKEIEKEVDLLFEEARKKMSYYKGKTIQPHEIEGSENNPDSYFSNSDSEDDYLWDDPDGGWSL